MASPLDAVPGGAGNECVWCRGGYSRGLGHPWGAVASGQGPLGDTATPGTAMTGRVARRPWGRGIHAGAAGHLASSQHVASSLGPGLLLAEAVLHLLVAGLGNRVWRGSLGPQDRCGLFYFLRWGLAVSQAGVALLC